MINGTQILLIMEYDGTGYHGFQWQNGLPSVQKEVEKAIRKLTGERRRVIAASRTDASVHARGQVVGFRTKSELPVHNFVSGLNHYLPSDIAVKAAYRVSDTFRVRRDAVSREYSYHILNSPTRSPIREGRAHLVVNPLNIEAMNRASQTLIGEHDFASFASGDGSWLESTEGVLKAGIAAARSGARLGEISAAIQNYAESRGYSVVREYTGHGIGRELHEEPQIANYGLAGTGPVLEKGMTLALEPMVNVGDWHTRVGDNQWTVLTADGSLSAHFEHTIAITDGEAEILTSREGVYA